MAGDRRRLRRREAIALFGLIAGMASAALLTQFIEPARLTGRAAI